jgi:hypothetical protein
MFFLDFIFNSHIFLGFIIINNNVYIQALDFIFLLIKNKIKKKKENFFLYNYLYM